MFQSLSMAWLRYNHKQFSRLSQFYIWILLYLPDGTVKSNAQHHNHCLPCYQGIFECLDRHVSCKWSSIHELQRAIKKSSIRETRRKIGFLKKNVIRSYLFSISDRIREVPPARTRGPNPPRHGAFEPLRQLVLLNRHCEGLAVQQLLLRRRHLPLWPRLGAPLAPRPHATSQVLFGHTAERAAHGCIEEHDESSLKFKIRRTKIWVSSRNFVIWREKRALETLKVLQNPMLKNQKEAIFWMEPKQRKKSQGFQKNPKRFSHSM